VFAFANMGPTASGSIPFSNSAEASKKASAAFWHIAKLAPLTPPSKPVNGPLQMTKGIASAFRNFHYFRIAYLKATASTAKSLILCAIVPINTYLLADKCRHS
jgi:hypothetical protein